MSSPAVRPLVPADRARQWPAPPPPAVRAVPSPALHFLLPFVYLAYSRLAEVITLGGFRLQLALAVVCLGLVILSGRFLPLVTRRPGIWYVALTLWFLAAVPFSVWPGGSFSFVTDSWYKSVLMFPLVAGAVVSLTDLRRLSVTFAAAGMTVAILLFTYGQVIADSRVAADVGETLRNPNDAAAQMLFTLPYAWFLASDRQRNTVLRLTAAFGVVIMLLASMKTGSRMGLVALLGMIAYAMLTSTPRIRVRLAAATITISLVALSMLPPEMIDRYLTTFTSDVARGDEVATALASTAGRTDLFWESVSLTFSHPIFGVGPAMFAVASADILRAQGRQAHWHDTHNSYTQISSEAGLPALVFYLAILYAAFSGARKVARHGSVELQPLATAQVYSLLAYVLCSAFSSLAYHIYLPTLAAVSVVIQRLQSEIPVDPPPTAPPRAATTSAARLPRPGSVASSPVAHA